MLSQFWVIITANFFHPVRADTWGGHDELNNDDRGTQFHFLNSSTQPDHETTRSLCGGDPLLHTKCPRSYLRLADKPPVNFGIDLLKSQTPPRWPTVKPYPSRRGSLFKCRNVLRHSRRIM
jgi:hypothetical protein